MSGGGAARDHAIDLDVLAVADDRKVAVLVADILDYAADRGATRIHLLPYKAEFFLVFRVSGRLEKIASAPLSMQAALIDGFKSYVRLTQTPSGQPALSRIRAEIRGKEYLLTTSVVPTLAGQRVVLALGSPVEPPESLIALGMNETEERALHTMVERGKGLVLIASSDRRWPQHYVLRAAVPCRSRGPYRLLGRRGRRARDSVGRPGPCRAWLPDARSGVLLGGDAPGH